MFNFEIQYENGKSAMYEKVDEFKFTDASILELHIKDSAKQYYIPLFNVHRIIRTIAK